MTKGCLVFKYLTAYLGLLKAFKTPNTGKV